MKSFLYGVEIKVFNQADKKNILRFPEESRFQLTDAELGLHNEGFLAI
jgi:hypothetical protein